MKVSKLIELLREVLDEHDDLPVVFSNAGGDGEDVEIAGISTILEGGSDRPVQVVICDKETLEAFT